MNKLKINFSRVDLSSVNDVVRLFSRISSLTVFTLFFLMIFFVILFRKTDEIYMGELISLSFFIGGTTIFYLYFFKMIREKFLYPLLKRLERMEELEKKCDVAHQVAHDIRSPLAILNIIAEPDVYSNSEESRTLLKEQVERIQGIANNLCQKINREIKEKEAISHIVKQIVSEKRLCFSKNDSIKIDYNLTDLDESIGGPLSSEDALELKRLLSNAINNSVEAFYEEANFKNVFIKVSSIIKNDRPMIQIVVKDNGRGIPPHIIKHLGKKGFSFGKEKLKEAGTGLGLFHAKTTMEQWNGLLYIQSQQGIGTSLVMTWPIEK